MDTGQCMTQFTVHFSCSQLKESDHIECEDLVCNHAD